MADSLHRETIAVLGGGPAGAAAALGLVRLGYRVTLVSEARPFKAIEGISERVVQGLQQAGLSHAVAGLPAATPRRVTWNGRTSAANSERLIDRTSFDQAIDRDLVEGGVALIRGRVQRVEHTDPGHRITVVASGLETKLEADFLVEARGRRAPAPPGKRVYGAKTISLLQRYRGPVIAAGSSVESFDEGWAWMASTPHGERYVQLTLDVGATSLPAKSALSDFFRHRLDRLCHSQAFLQDIEPLSAPYARSSTPVLCEESVGDDWIRIGDAAMAVDPLSGNGIFQALSSALQAPAVIHTLLRCPLDRELAKTFHRQRISELFYRFARTGRDFHNMERQWLRQAFWCNRCRWPDSEPLHTPLNLATMRVTTLPVIEDGYVVPREGVVTPDRPTGIWHVDGVPLAPVVQALKSRVSKGVPDSKMTQSRLTSAQQKLMSQLLAQSCVAPHGRASV